MPRYRRVEVVYPYRPVGGAGIDVAAPGGDGWGKVAADESLEDAVAAEGDEGDVVRVPAGGEGVGFHAVVEGRGVVVAFEGVEGGTVEHFPDTY